MSGVAIELIDLFYGVNKGRSALEFIPEFCTHFMGMVRSNEALHAELTSTDRYKKALERMQKRGT